MLDYELNISLLYFNDFFLLIIIILDHILSIIHLVRGSGLNRRAWKRSEKKVFYSLQAMDS